MDKISSKKKKISIALLLCVISCFHHSIVSLTSYYVSYPIFVIINSSVFKSSFFHSVSEIV